MPYTSPFSSSFQILAAPAISGVLLAPTAQVSYGLLFVAYITAETWLGPAAAIVQVCCLQGRVLLVCLGCGSNVSVSPPFHP